MRRLLFAAIAVISLGAHAQQPYVFAEYRQSLLPGVGLQVHDRIAIEISYFEHERSATRTFSQGNSGPKGPGGSASTFEADAAERVFGPRLALVGRLPVGPVHLLGSFGVYGLRGDLQLADGSRISGSANVAGIGIGVSYAFTRALELRVTADWLQGYSEMFGSGLDLDSMRSAAIAALYRF